MQSAMLVAQQVLCILIYVAIGYIACRKGLVTQEATKIFSKMLTIIVMPTMMINSFYRPYEAEHTKGLILAFALAIIFHIMAIIISTLAIKKRPDSNYRVEQMCAVYSNCGFMAFPLLEATIGDLGLFYGAAFCGIFGFFSWSHGILILSPSNSKINMKKVLINPGSVALLIGLLLYFSQIHLPYVLETTLANVAAVNTPLSMIIVGIFLAFVKPKDIFTNKFVNWASALRIIILPLIMLLLVKITGVTNLLPFAADVALANIIAAACPVAAFTILMVANMGLDSEHAAKALANTTLLSVISLPLITLLGTILLY